MTIKKPFNIWVEEQANSPAEDFRFAVVQEATVIGRFTTEPYALLMADTLLRAELIQELGGNLVDEILGVLVDQISELRSRKWMSLPK